MPGKTREKDLQEGENRRQKILTAPLFPLLIRTAIPTMVGMMVTMLYNLTDTFWIGRLGDKSMTAAIGVVFAFVSFIQAVGFWFGYGSGNTMSRLLGGKEEEEAKIISSVGVVLSVCSGVAILACCLLFLDPLVMLLGGGASESLRVYTREYLLIMLFTVPFSLFSTTVYNQLRLCGNVKDAMIGLLVGMLGNIVLDPLFILGFHMGIAGAGIATLLGNILSTVVIILLSRRHGNIPVSFRHCHFTGKRIYHILAGGAPNFSRQGITSIASILLNNLAAGYGETLIAALTVATRAGALGYMLMIGFGQGFQPICAMNYGAGKYERVKKALGLTVLTGSGFMCVAAILIAVFAGPLAALLSHNEDVVQLSVVILRFQCISMPFMALYALSSMFLQNVGRYFPALLVSVARQGVFYIPLLLVLPFFLGEKGFYIVQPAADLISVVCGLLIVAFSWQGIFAEKK
ncbi:MAG: MATE family efflux transporter [Lachnospiraceae bacterium]|nr:MATE family efflux transporter [Lachnospiraceae bacterium]